MTSVQTPSPVPSVARLPKGRNSVKSFSGKLPFRTQPELHELIYWAAQKSGKSINAWMEEKLKDAVSQEQTEEGSETLASPSFQQRFQDKPDQMFDLIDFIRPALKSQKTRDTAAFIGEVETLMVTYEKVQAALPTDRLDPDRLMEITLTPFLDRTSTAPSVEPTSVEPTSVEPIHSDITVALAEAIDRWDAVFETNLRSADLEQKMMFTQSIGQILISIATIRLSLKDPSLDNTIALLQQIIHHFLA